MGSYVEASTDAIVTNNNTELITSCVARGPFGSRQGSVKCSDIKMGKILIGRTVTHVPWPSNGQLLYHVEAGERKGIYSIKHNNIDFLNIKGKKLDWDVEQP